MVELKLFLATNYSFIILLIIIHIISDQYNND